MPTTPTKSLDARTPRSEPPMLEAERERDLLALAQGGDRAAQSELVSAHLRLVRAVARRVTHSPTEDAIAEGVVGLLEAIQRFDASRGCRLATYAAHWIRARVQRFVLSNRGIVGSPDTRASRRVFGRLARVQRVLATRTSRPGLDEIAEEIGVHVSDVEGVMSTLRGRDVPIDTTRDAGAEEVWISEGPEDRFAEAELAEARRRVIAGVLALLPERERRVVQERALAEDGATLDQLAITLDLSRERVRQLEVRALRRIGDALVVEGLAA